MSVHGRNVSQRRDEIGRGRASSTITNNPLDPNTFTLDEGEQQNLFDELLRMVSTNTAQARNVSLEQSALSNASDANREASLRGVDYRGGMAVQAGTTDLQKYIAGFNREGTQQAFQNRMAFKQLQLQKDAQEGSLWQDLMGILGGAAGGLGAYAGFKLFSKAGNDGRSSMPQSIGTLP